MKRIIVLAIACACVALPAMTATAQNNRDRTISLSDGDPATNDWTGLYAKVGLSVGFPNNPKGSRNKADPGAAVAFGGGYRFNKWFAFELDMNVTAGHDVKRSDDDVVIFAFTMNQKSYPLAEADLLPEWMQPYILFGFGGGVVDAGDLLDESTFMMRFAFGSEFMLWDHFGLYVDGGYMTFDDAEAGLEGTGQMIFGGVYRF